LQVGQETFAFFWCLPFPRQEAHGFSSSVGFPSSVHSPDTLVTRFRLSFMIVAVPRNVIWSFCSQPRQTSICGNNEPSTRCSAPQVGHSITLFLDFAGMVLRRRFLLQFAFYGKPMKKPLIV
jgi:hypothetical protein